MDNVDTGADVGTGPAPLEKVPSGVAGLDEVTGGGLPRGRPTLVAGSAGCGKTLLAMQFLVHGALEYGEPGVHVAFEETPAELTTNLASLGYDLPRLERERLLWLDHVRLDPVEIIETGEYNLEGLFVRLAAGVDAVGAKRVVLDTIEVLFGALSDTVVIRSELQRLFRWFKERGLTAVITGESGRDGSLTRYGIEEYVSDCVIVLDHRVRDDLSTRRLRVVKYRGSLHGTNEYPFLIGDQGIMVLPVTSLGLDHDAPTDRVSSGIDRLDEFAGGGFYRGSSILIGGGAGTGKTTFAAHFVDAACRHGDRALYVSHEESPRQLVRNMRSVGLDLQRWVDAGRLRMHAVRPVLYGLETHLATFIRSVDEFRPDLVVVDPITSMLHMGTTPEVTAMLTREVDFLKSRQVTAIFTTLMATPEAEHSEVAISSLIDTWLLTRSVETNGERNRIVYVAKSRGSAHSNQLVEFELSSHGVQMLDPYVGPAGVLTGSARVAQEAADAAERVARIEELERQRRDVEQHRQAVELQIDALRRELDADARALEQLAAEADARDGALTDLRVAMARRRRSTAGGDRSKEVP